MLGPLPSASLTHRACDRRALAPAPGSLTVDERLNAETRDDDDECVKLGCRDGSLREEEDDASEVVVEVDELKGLFRVLGITGEMDPEAEVVADS